MEEIYDFETEQLETVLTDIDTALSAPRGTLQLPKGYESYEKFERKALKLKEHIELELDERRQVDDVISFFVSKSNNKGVDLLSDDQFYQPASQKQPLQPVKQQAAQTQQLYLNPQNLAKLPDSNLNIPNVESSYRPSQQEMLENSTTQIQQSPYDGSLSEVHSSVSK